MTRPSCLINVEATQDVEGQRLDRQGGQSPGAAEEMEYYVICELFEILKWPRNESRAPLGTSILK